MIGDLVSNNEDGNFGFIAHIVAEEPGGPRGDVVRSPLLADDPANLMLMCHVHHKLIDVDEVADYPEQRLLDLKARHEQRVATLTDIVPERASIILRYGARIGGLESLVSFPAVRTALVPHRYPANNTSIGIEIVGSAFTDGEENFWRTEPENLRRQFDTIVRPRITSREINHLSVFGLGPMPLLVHLGTLLGDIVPADVYQLHREPSGWSWAEDGPRLDFEVSRPRVFGPAAALKLGISASVTDQRIHDALGQDASIWSLVAANPGNDAMRYRGDLARFRELMRGLYNEIKLMHGERATIHVFPAVPVTVAIELGRIRMPKADLPLLIYDSIRNEGFVPRLTIA